MDEQKKYSSFSLKNQDSVPTEESIRSDSADNKEDGLFSDINFAEIEIDTTPDMKSASKNVQRFLMPSPLPEQLPDKSPHPIRTKFYDMRSLATKKPYARNDAELFYRQAKFMEGFTDNYQEDEKFFMYYPYYQHMGFEQLRTYFTWRAKFRVGDVVPTSVSYMFVYVYELLHNIGVSNPSEGLDMLLNVWNTCLEFTPVLESYLPVWFRDYHIYYDLPQCFSDFAKKHDLRKYFTGVTLLDIDLENSLDVWNALSGYNITKSVFYNQGNETLMRDCFDAVLDGIRDLCTNNNLPIEKLFVYSNTRPSVWHPFKQALFFDWRKQNNRTVDIPGYGKYFYKNNRWSASVPIYYSSQRDFMGYVIRKTESCLRKSLNYKNRLSVDLKPSLYEAFYELKELDNKGIGLEYAIEKAVTNFYRELTRTVVTVDHQNLDRIRQEALGTQEKLVVEDFGVLEVCCEEWRAVSSIDQKSESQAQTSKPTSNSDTGERVHSLSGDTDGWAALKDVLSAIEIQALTMILRGDADIKEFSDKNGIMYELLADSINEKACDFIGDSILETSEVMTIFDEYKQYIELLIIN